MTFFADKNTPTYKAIGKLKLEQIELIESSDEERVEYVSEFLEDYWNEHGEKPKIAVRERLANFILRPYIGLKIEDGKEVEYKILSSYSIDRREGKQVGYIDELEK